MDILKHHTILTKSRLSKKNRLETITEITDEANQTKKKLKEEIVGLKVAIKTKMDKYWTLWTQLLDDSLKDKWDVIVEEQTNNEKGYMASGGVRTVGKRGKTIPAMKACIRQWLLQVMKPNTTE